MEILTVNLIPSVRRERRHGKDYLVVPMTLIVSGVLRGSQGSLYYPPEEIARNTSAWNGVPLVVYHPTWNGQHVSARDPDVLDRYWVGNVYRARFIPKAKDGRSKLTAEGWFDEAATRRVDVRVWEALNRGEPIELSTGLFTENQPAPYGSRDDRGREYSYIARNYAPDHLAVLPDQTGACSLADGCGVLIANRYGYVVPTVNCAGDADCGCGCMGEATPHLMPRKPRERRLPPHYSDEVGPVSLNEVAAYLPGGRWSFRSRP